MVPLAPLSPEERAGAGAWSEPGAYPVAPGVHRIPLPLPGDGLHAINVYAIEDGDRILLVDAGWQREECWTALERGLAAIGAATGDVERVVVTHMHRDHYGQATRLRQEARAWVLLGAGERRSLETAFDERSALAAREEHRRQMRRWDAAALAAEVEAMMRGGGFGGIPRDIGLWGAPDVYAEEGMAVELRSRRLEIIATPGHTRGHVVFVDRDHRLLFAGDHILPHITPSIGFEPFADGRALTAFLASLARVRPLPVELVLPAHGPEFSGLAERVDALAAHHATRLDACATAVRGGDSTVMEVARSLRWTRHDRRYADLDLFNRLLAVIETAAHLELLVVQGRLAGSEEDGVRRHSAAAAG